MPFLPPNQQRQSTESRKHWRQTNMMPNRYTTCTINLHDSMSEPDMECRCDLPAMGIFSAGSFPHHAERPWYPVNCTASQLHSASIGWCNQLMQWTSRQQFCYGKHFNKTVSWKTQSSHSPVVLLYLFWKSTFGDQCRFLLAGWSSCLDVLPVNSIKLIVFL